jgi:hypothetical protein
MDVTTMSAGMIVAMGIYHFAIFILRFAWDSGGHQISPFLEAARDHAR